jgi:hypothetical protein
VNFDTTQPPVQLLPRLLSSSLSGRGSEAGHSRSSSAKIKNAYSYTTHVPNVFMIRRSIKLIIGTVLLSVIISLKHGGLLYIPLALTVQKKNTRSVFCVAYYY